MNAHFFTHTDRLALQANLAFLVDIYNDSIDANCPVFLFLYFLYFLFEYVYTG